MNAKAYVLFISAPPEHPKFTAAAQKEIVRVVGGEISPLMATERAFAVAYVSTSDAKSMIQRVREVVGSRLQILIAELGTDHYQLGYPEHHRWLEKLRSMTDKGAAPALGGVPAPPEPY